MNGIERLQKTVFEFSFAGFALATMKMLRLSMLWADMCRKGSFVGKPLHMTARFIQKSPEKYVPLFKKDPEAFVLEAMTEFFPNFHESLATSLAPVLFDAQDSQDSEAYWKHERLSR